MRSLVGVFRSPALLTLSGALLVAGCSSESTRFNDSPFSNPFASKSPSGSSDVTGSINAPRSAPPASQVQSTPLPPPPRAGGYSGGYGASSGGGGMSSYQPRPQNDVTGSVAGVPQNPPPVVAQAPTAPNQGNWNWDGGTAISVGPNETIDILANRYGVPASAIAQANGISTTTPIYAGQRLVIPRYNYSGAQQTAAAPAPKPAAPHAPALASAPRSTPAIPSARAGKVHIVQPGEMLSKIAAMYGKPLTEVAAANNIQPYKQVRMGERIVIPGVAANAAPAAPVA